MPTVLLTESTASQWLNSAGSLQVSDTESHKWDPGQVSSANLTDDTLSRVPGLLPVSAASPSMDHEHGTVCQPILEHQIWLSAPSSVISRPTCFSSSLRCCWQVGSAPFVRRHYDCSASSAPFTNIQTYLLTYPSPQTWDSPAVASMLSDRCSLVLIFCCFLHVKNCDSVVL